MIEAESERLLRIADQTSVALRVDAGTLGYTIENLEGGVTAWTLAGLPLEANVQFLTVMATNMPFIGRG